jgi:hypothetical protein
MRCIGRRACFEARPARVGSLLNMRYAIALRKTPHSEAPREARPRRTHDILPAMGWFDAIAV